MNRLVDKFDDIVDDIIDEQQDSLTGEWYTTGTSSIGYKCAEEAKKLAVEFAKQLMETEVTKYSKGVVGDPVEKVSYLPHEYSLMKGELIQKGEELFNEFIDKYYE